ncbi:hypothetical protein Tco_1505564 [Tanacetum coccineum]
MMNLSFDLNVRKDSSDTDEAAQNGGNPKSVTFEIHHGGCFTPTPSRSYIDGHVSSVNVVDIEEFCLHDLKDMMAKYVKDNKIILVYVEHGSSNVDSSIFVTPKYGVAIAVDNHLRRAPIEIDSSPDVSSKALSIGEVMKSLSKKQPASSVEGPNVVESVDPFDGLDEILGDYANTREEITGEQMTVHVGNSSTVDDDLDYDPKHDEVFGDDEHIVEDVLVSINNFNFIPDPKHDLSIGVVEVHEHDLDVIDYDSFGSDLDDGIMGDYVIKTLATNPNIPARAVQDQMQKQFDVGVSKMKAFRAKRIATDKMTSSFKEHYSLFREYAQEMINQNPGTTVRIDVQQEPNLDHLPRTFRRVYVCLGSLKQGFRACAKEILGLDGCFMSGPWPDQILTTVEVDVNNRIYPIAYVIVEAESRAKYDLLLNNICEVFNRQLVDGRNQPIITCLEYIIEYLMKRIVVVQKVIAKTVGPLTPSGTTLFDVIKKKLLTTLFNGMEASYLGRADQSSVVNVEIWVKTGKAAGVKVVQVKLVQDKLLVQGMSLVKLLVQGMHQVKLLVLVNPVQHQAQQLVQGMPQLKLLVLVNLVQHQAQQDKDQVNIVQDQLKHVKDLGKVFKHQYQLQVLDHKD